MARNAAALLPPPPPIATADQSTLPVATAEAGVYNYQANSGAAASSTTSTSSSSSSPAESLSPSILVTVLILATAVIVSASLYLLLRFISRHCRRHPHPQTDAVDSLRQLRHHNVNGNSSRHHRHSSSRRVSPEENGWAIDSLPLFTFASIVGASRNSSSIAGDCAVCLSTFEPHDQLRLLPICCHAFHSSCIDTWLAANQTCPLCRSPIFVSETEILSKILMRSSSGTQRSGSFRVEIGNVSGRRIPSDTSGDNLRSYSIGSFDYVIEDALSEITIASTRQGSDCAFGDKNDAARPEAAVAPGPPGSSIAAEVGGGGRSWLRDYVDRLTSAASFSLSSSFRSSGRFFTGSSRRTEFAGACESDLEASRLGDEISEMFRWLSGV
ncbi:hypothetical protein Dimus_005711 [Dionaea muscipula]